MDNGLLHRFIIIYRLIFVSVFAAIAVFLIGGFGRAKDVVLLPENNVETTVETTQNSIEYRREITHFSTENPAFIAHSLREPVEAKPTVKPVVEQTTVKQTERQTEPGTYNSGGSLVYLGKFRCTAYCPCYECSEGYGRGTATGAVATANHTVAVDPGVIPYGTYLMINGVTYRAEDCGGGVNGNSIDIFFDTHWETEQFGLRYLDVYLVR